VGAGRRYKLQTLFQIIGCGGFTLLHAAVLKSQRNILTSIINGCYSLVCVASILLGFRSDGPRGAGTRRTERSVECISDTSVELRVCVYTFLSPLIRLLPAFCSGVKYGLSH